MSDDYFRRDMTYDQAPQGSKNEDEIPITMRNSGIIPLTKYECRGAAETALGVVRRHRRSPDMSSVRIPLLSRKYPGLYAVVDEEDFELINQFKWTPSVRVDRDNTYAKHRSGNTTLLMHRLITSAPDGVLVDHIDRDGLNNRRSNLRLCSTSQNLRNRGPNKNNTTGFKGVAFYKAYQKWSAQIMYERSPIHIGYFDSPEEAALAYDRKAIELFGEYAYRNFPDHE